LAAVSALSISILAFEFASTPALYASSVINLLLNDCSSKISFWSNKVFWNSRSEAAFVISLSNSEISVSAFLESRVNCNASNSAFSFFLSSTFKAYLHIAFYNFLLFEL